MCNTEAFFLLWTFFICLRMKTFWCHLFWSASLFILLLLSSSSSLFLTFCMFYYTKILREWFLKRISHDMFTYFRANCFTRCIFSVNKIRVLNISSKVFIFSQMQFNSSWKLTKICTSRTVFVSEGIYAL